MLTAAARAIVGATEVIKTKIQTILVVDTKIASFTATNEARPLAVRNQTDKRGEVSRQRRAHSRNRFAVACLIEPGST